MRTKRRQTTTTVKKRRPVKKTEEAIEEVSQSLSEPVVPPEDVSKEETAPVQMEPTPESKSSSPSPIQRVTELTLAPKTSQTVQVKPSEKSVLHQDVATAVQLRAAAAKRGINALPPDTENVQLQNTLNQGIFVHVLIDGIPRQRVLPARGTLLLPKTAITEHVRSLVARGAVKLRAV